MQELLSPKQKIIFNNGVWFNQFIEAIRNDRKELDKQMPISLLCRNCPKNHDFFIVRGLSMCRRHVEERQAEARAFNKRFW